MRVFVAFPISERLSSAVMRIPEMHRHSRLIRSLCRLERPFQGHDHAVRFGRLTDEDDRLSDIEPCFGHAVEFQRLGCSNISVSNTDAMNCVPSLGQVDLLYLDPSRRDKAGKKVFLLEDCEPDILAIKPQLFSYCPQLLLKLSPMADISLVAERLGPCLREVHVVGTDGECKELLCWLEKTWRGGYTITVADLPDAPFTFLAADEAAAEPRFPQSAESLVGRAVIVPGAVALKAGCANLLCQRNGWTRLGRHTSIYLSDEGAWRIAEVLPFSNPNIRALGRKYPFSEVTARNIPVTSEELKRKMGVAPSDNTHIYACTCDFADGSSGRFLIVARRAGD